MPFPYGNRSKGWYDTAQICLNGHIINTQTETSPEYNKSFCDKCGAETITSCPKCGARISGQLHPEASYLALPMITAPKFCSTCGAPYPWTESRLKAAHELANEISGISEDERKFLAQSLDELVKDSPQTQVAAVRFKKIMPKVGRQIRSEFREILIGIISETAKKVIWP